MTITHALPIDDSLKVVEPPVFPLPLTPFEFFFLCDERPDYRGVIPIELHATGCLDHAALESAFEVTLRRHPMLVARAKTENNRWPQWVMDTPQQVHFANRGEHLVPRDPLNDRGAQLEVQEEGDQVQFKFAFRHVAVDGLGTFQFIADLFIAYAHFSAGHTDSPPWRRVDPERLLDRDGHQLFRRRLRWGDLRRIARVHVPLSLRQAALVSNEKLAEPIGAESVTLPTDFLVAHLSVEETKALSDVAAKQSVMVNDLLVRDYFMTIAAWNHGTSQERGPLRIMIPINMRRREDLRMSAANVFSYAFLTRRGAACEDRQQLLTFVRDQMSRIKGQKLGLYYEAGLRMLCQWPAFVRWSVRRRWAFATAVFTNLGTSFDNVPLPANEGRKVAGDLIFTTGAGAGPVRPDTRISFSAHNYGQQLSIGARCDPLTLSPVQQQALLDSFMEHLRTTIRQQS